jgi:hypothetical protein
MLGIFQYRYDYTFKLFTYTMKFSLLSAIAGFLLLGSFVGAAPVACKRDSIVSAC